MSLTLTICRSYHVFAGVRKESDKDAIMSVCVSKHGDACRTLLMPVILDVTRIDTISLVCMQSLSLLPFIRRSHMQGHYSSHHS